MKRNVDLEREILLSIEDSYKPGDKQVSLNIDGYSEEEIYEHAKLLYQAGLIQSFLDTSTMSTSECFVGNLTNEGFDYVEAVRNDSAWTKTKEFAKKKGIPLVSESLKTVASALVTAATNAAAKSILG